MAAIVLKYSIAKVSSEEEECSASELLSPGPDCKGWATDKYCVYPQVCIAFQIWIDKNQYKKLESYLTFMHFIFQMSFGHYSGIDVTTKK